MAYDVGTRQRYRHAVSAVTGVAALGVLTACGWVAGVAARDHQRDLDARLASEKVRATAAQRAWRLRVRQTRAWERAQAAEILANPDVRTVWRKRPLRTVVDTRVVHVASVGTGGVLSSGSPDATGATAGAPSSGGAPSSAGGSSSGGGGQSSARPPTSPPRSGSGGGSAPAPGGSSGGSSGGGSSAPPPPPPPPPPPTYGS